METGASSSVFFFRGVEVRGPALSLTSRCCTAASSKDSYRRSSSTSASVKDVTVMAGGDLSITGGLESDLLRLSALSSFDRVEEGLKSADMPRWIGVKQRPGGD